MDSVQEVEGAEVRHCNWVRFIQSTHSIDEVNIVAVRVKGHPVFQVSIVVDRGLVILKFLQAQ